MSTKIVRSQKPEEKELIKKLAELEELEEELTQRELELTTFLAEMRTFEAVYLRRVGVRYSKLDELEVRIAEAQARLNPQDGRTAERVTQARRRAQESANATSDICDTPQKDKPKASDSLRKLYRDVARKIHPDLCTDEKERLHREKLMAEANSAYEDGDEERLRKILSEWETSPESIKGEDIGAQLVRVLRKISQVERRLCNITSEIEEMRKSDLHVLRMKAEESKAEGRDLVAEMATRLDRDISKAEDRLREIVQKRMKK